MAKPLTKVAATLVKMRQLLDDPRHWVQYCTAADRRNRACMASGKAAAKWCLVGAALKVIKESEGSNKGFADVCEALDDALRRMKRLRPMKRYGPGFESCTRQWITFPDWNDWATTTHADVLKLLDNAIAAELKAGQQ